MKIFFVMIRPGYWHSFVTTNEALATAKAAENSNYELRSTDILPIDFVPDEITMVGGLGSILLSKEEMAFVNLEDYFFFKQVFKPYDTQFVATIHKSRLEMITDKIVELETPDYDFLGSYMKVKKP